MRLLLSVVMVLVFSLQSVCAEGTSYNGDSARNPEFLWMSTLIIVLFILSVVIYGLTLYIRHIREEQASNRITDAETGLANMQYFKNYFENTICDAFGNLYYVAYIVLDINYLRSYHGDSSFVEFLGYATTVLSENTEDNELSARITENSFAVEFRATDDAEAVRRIEQILAKLNDFGGAGENDDKGSKPLCRCAIYHLLSSDKDCELLLFNLRRNCNKIFDTDVQVVLCDAHSMNEVQEEEKLTESILKGLDNDEFKMYLQFIVDNKTGNIVSAEALSRWESPEKGLITPNRYIENMEESGLISRHDFHMFELVCRQLEKWRGTEFEDISISCNFTRITLSEEDFIDKLLAISKKYNFDNSRVAIEITEDAMEKDIATASANVVLCKNNGFKVYLDDLGSGYTSLYNLCDYPIDTLKLDRDILLRTDAQKGKELFSGLVALAHSLNIRVICEGVEKDEQNNFVNSTDCDYIQGWYYSKPIPAEESEEFIRQYK